MKIGQASCLTWSEAGCLGYFHAGFRIKYISFLRKEYLTKEYRKVDLTDLFRRWNGD
jgi:hypothetical protein